MTVKPYQDVLESAYYKETIEKTLEKSKKSGKRIRKSFGKDAFAAAFPEALRDPRFVSSMTPDTFILDVTPMKQLMVSELRELCDRKEVKDTNLAIQKRLSVLQFADTQLVCILQQDYDFLKTGKGTVVTSAPKTPPTIKDSMPDPSKK